MRSPQCQFENRESATANPREFYTTCLKGTNPAELPVGRPTDQKHIYFIPGLMLR